MGVGTAGKGEESGGYWGKAQPLLTCVGAPAPEPASRCLPHFSRHGVWGGWVSPPLDLLAQLPFPAS